MQKQRTIVITGATNGIGRLAAATLCRDGGTLVLIARSADKARETQAEILRSGSRATIDTVLADFTDLASVAAAAAEVARRHDHLDGLVNNAGIHAFEQRITGDGFAEMISVNYLAPWLLTAILRDRLMASGNARIVTVASEASRRAKGMLPAEALLDTAPFSAIGSSKVYGSTKLLNIMFSLELARQLRATEAAVNCVDPGFNVTGLGRELPFSGALARVLLALGIGTPERGASLIRRLAEEPEFGTVTGAYYSGGAPENIVPAEPANNREARRLLWIRTADLLKDFLPSASQ